MDRDNLRKSVREQREIKKAVIDEVSVGDLQRLQQRTGGKAKIMLFGEFGGKKRAEEVDDPYYGGRDGFEIAYEKIVRFSKNFLKETFPDVSP